VTEPRILALDTSSFAASAAVVEGERTLGVVGLRTRRPSRALLPLVERLFQSLGLRPADLDAWAVTTGPGSFTGLRVGMTAIQTLAHALERPVLGVATLEALAAAARRHPPPLCILLDARRGRVYAATFTLAAGWPVPMGPVEDADPAEYLSRLRWPATLVGDGLRAHPEAEAAAPSGSRRREVDPFLAPAVGALAHRAWQRGEAVAAGGLRPFYVRLPDARLPSGAPPGRDG